MAYYIMFNRYDPIPLFFTEWSGRNSIWLSILERGLEYSMIAHMFAHLSVQLLFVPLMY